MPRINFQFFLNYKLHLSRTIATGFGCGLLPKAPGTWGSVAALPVAYAISYWGNNLILLFCIIFGFILGTIVSDITSNSLGESDPSEIVIDEIIGQWITLILIPPNIILYLCGFILFRVFDILKPWPISWAEKRFKGGFGIMFDDILAALYSGLILYCVCIIYNFYAEV